MSQAPHLGEMLQLLICTCPPPSYEDVKSNGGSQNASEAAPVSKAAQKALYFLAEVASSTSQVCVYSCSVEDALCFMDMLLGVWEF